MVSLIWHKTKHITRRNENKQYRSIHIDGDKRSPADISWRMMSRVSSLVGCGSCLSKQTAYLSIQCVPGPAVHCTLYTIAPQQSVLAVWHTADRPDNLLPSQTTDAFTNECQYYQLNYSVNQIISQQAGRRIGSRAALPSFKRPLLSADASNDILPNPVNFTPPTRVVYFMLYAAMQRVAIHYVMNTNFCRSAVPPKCFFSQSSKPNELIL